MSEQVKEQAKPTSKSVERELLRTRKKRATLVERQEKLKAEIKELNVKCKELEKQHETLRYEERGNKVATTFLKELKLSDEQLAEIVAMYSSKATDSTAKSDVESGESNV